MKKLLILTMTVGGLVFIAGDLFAQTGGAAGSTGGANSSNPSGATGSSAMPAPSMPSQPGATSQPGAIGSQNPPAAQSHTQPKPGGGDVNVIPERPAGNPPAGATTGVTADPALNRMGVGGREQREGFRESRQDLRQDLRSERREGRQATDADRWRYVLHNGEWWYWMPSDYWVFYRDNTWNRFDPLAYQPFRYRTGYRGVTGQSDQSYYTDENGRRYRRDYSPDRRLLRNPSASEQHEAARTGSAIGGAVGGDRGARPGAEIGGAVEGPR